MIDTKKLQVAFFFLVFGLMSVLIFSIYKPFFQVILSAGIFSVILFPLFAKNLRLTRGNREIAAALTLLFAGVFVVIPLYFFIMQILRESNNLYLSVMTNGGVGVFANIAASVNHWVLGIFPNSSFQLQSYLSDLFRFVSQNFASLLSGTAFALLELLLVVLSTFFFLKDAPFFLEGFKKLSPLDDSYDKDVLSSVGKTINSVVRGALSVAVIQGLVLMIGFYLFEVPNAFLWGFIAMIAALIPGIGTAMIFAPAIFYLFFINHTVTAIGLLVWSFFLHGSVDNFVAPILYGKGMSVHPLFVMFSVLGGLMLFGPLGFLFGPVLLSVFLALYDIYGKMIWTNENSG